MKKPILLIKFMVFTGLALFLIIRGDEYFDLPSAWRYILISVLLLLGALRLFEFLSFRKKHELEE